MRIVLLNVSFEATVMVVHAAFAKLLAAAPRREGTLGKLRRGPIQTAPAQRPTG